ncbi:hypothetical protein [Stieleria varia]|nr:hypothetical protein [Stieleria varia]
MTWQTPSGNRTLSGHESELVRHSIANMVEELASCRETDDSPCICGIALFDELTWTQQLAILERLANYLLQRTHETLELTGVHEAAVAAIYRNILQQIEIEIELDDVSPTQFRHQWRELVVAANEEARDAVMDSTIVSGADASLSLDDSDDHVISADSTDIEKWEWIVESLADQVLWDRDFEMAGDMIDAPPEQAAALRAMLGINSEYYTAIAPDPTDSQVDQLFDSVHDLTRRKPR